MTISGEILYAFITRYPDAIQRGRAHRARMRVEFEEVVVPVTEAGSTFSLISPEAVAVVDEQAVTVPGSGVEAGIPHYDLAADLLDDYDFGPGWMERWKLVLPDGTTRTVDREAVLARIPLQPPAGLSDLERRFPGLSALYGQDVPSLQGFGEEAWADIIVRIVCGGELPSRVKSGWAFRAAWMELTAALFFDWLNMRQPNNGWDASAKERRTAYEAAYTAVTYATDRDEDGLVDDPTQRESAKSGIVTPNGAPTSHGVNLPDPSWL